MSHQTSQTQPGVIGLKLLISMMKIPFVKRLSLMEEKNRPYGNIMEKHNYGILFIGNCKNPVCGNYKYKLIDYYYHPQIFYGKNY